jgi:hypothetical protein
MDCELLRRRVRRLAKLIEMQAPGIIIYLELRGIQQLYSMKRKAA